MFLNEDSPHFSSLWPESYGSQGNVAQLYQRTLWRTFLKVKEMISNVSIYKNIVYKALNTAGMILLIVKLTYGSRNIQNLLLILN